MLMGSTHIEYCSNHMWYETIIFLPQQIIVYYVYYIKP